ncbi:MAG: HU family DNA-binding protein [Bifidobacteriaceae bacterium]|nr:HU family DNA-binding protein [Aeriscardovia sp.]MEE1324612.1 HU family DNA-binding protein [Bifidobacteriaceae bacterium]
MAYNKADLVSKVAQKSNLTKAQSEAAINAFQEVLIDSLKSGEGLKLTGIFSAERVKRAARTGRNPRTNEIIKIPARYGVKLQAGSLLKKAVSE